MIRLFVFLLAIGLSNINCNSGTEGHKESSRPNILFAIADDASWKHFGAYGCNWVSTPAFDRVAREGLLFNNTYTPNAKCAPSRSCILTGRNSWQLEEAANHSPFFPAKFKTFPEALGKQGYWVGSVAKGWAPGDPGIINAKKRQLTGPKFNKYKLTPPTPAISDNDYAKNFEDFLEQRPGEEPFCFWYGSFEPHRSYEYGSGARLSGKQLSDIDEVPAFWPDVDTIRHDMLDYALELEYFDSHLGKMLDALEKSGELANTIVIVTADNGMPFPRIKGQAYEYSNHLPLAIMWGDAIKEPGRVLDEYVSFIDFAPTILEAAGVDAPSAGMQPTTGKSLLPIFQNDTEKVQKTWRDHVLIGKERHDVGRPDDKGYPIRGIVQGDYLYLRNYRPERWPKGNPETGYLNCDGSPTKTYILNTRRRGETSDYWDLNFGKRIGEELYNITEDPYCMNNLIGDFDFMEIRGEMFVKLAVELRADGDPRILGDGDIFDDYPYSGAVKDYYNRYMAGEDVPAGWVNKSDYEVVTE